MDSHPDDPLGRRLANQEGRLRLLLLHLSGRAVRSRVDADDLVQEVFLRALAAPERIPGSSERESELFRYLRAIARHAVIDVVRAARAQKRDGREEPLVRSDWSRTNLGESRLAAPGPGPLTRLVGGETAEEVARAFDRLTPEHRRVLGLRKFEGLTAAEAGERMGRGEKAIHSLYRRALEAWEMALSRGK